MIFRVWKGLLACFWLLPAVSNADVSRFATEDARLLKPIDIRANCLTARRFTELLGKKVGAKMSATSRVGDDLLIVSALARPAAEIMDRVAAHFSFTWERSGKTAPFSYVLTQSDVQVGAERKAREARDAEIFDNARSLMNALVAAYKLGDTERATKAAEYQKAVLTETDPERIKELNRGDAAMCADIVSLRARLFAAVGMDLSEASWQKLRNGETLVYSTRPISGERKLPQPAMKDVETVITWVKILCCQRGMQGAIYSVRGVDGIAELSDHAAVDLDHPPAYLICNIQLRYFDGILASAVTVRTPERHAIAGGSYYLKDTKQPAGTKPATPPDIPEESTLNQKYQLPEGLKAFARSGKLRPGFFFRSAWAEDKSKEFTEPLSVSYGELLLSLADAAGMLLVADAFDQHDMEPSVLPKGTIADWLTAVCKGTESQWAIDGQWITVRCPRYPIYRALQLSPALRARIYEAFAKYGYPGIKFCAEIARQVTSEPKWSVAPFIRGLGLTTTHFPVTQYPWLKVIDVLPDETLGEMLKGRSVLLGALPPATVPALRNAVVSGWPIPGMEPTEELSTAAALAISFELQGDVIQYHDDAELGPSLFTPMTFERCREIFDAYQHGRIQDLDGVTFGYVRFGSLATYAIHLIGDSDTEMATFQILQMPPGPTWPLTSPPPTGK